MSSSIRKTSKLIDFAEMLLSALQKPQDRGAINNAHQRSKHLRLLFVWIDSANRSNGPESI